MRIESPSLHLPASADAEARRNEAASEKLVPTPAAPRDRVQRSSGGSRRRSTYAELSVAALAFFSRVSGVAHPSSGLATLEPSGSLNVFNKANHSTEAAISYLRVSPKAAQLIDRLLTTEPDSHYGPTKLLTAADRSSSFSYSDWDPIIFWDDKNKVQAENAGGQSQITSPAANLLQELIAADHANSNVAEVIARRALAHPQFGDLERKAIVGKYNAMQKELPAEGLMPNFPPASFNKTSAVNVSDASPVDFPKVTHIGLGTVTQTNTVTEGRPPTDAVGVQSLLNAKNERFKSDIRSFDSSFNQSTVGNLTALIRHGDDLTKAHAADFAKRIVTPAAKAEIDAYATEAEAYAERILFKHQNFG